MPNRYSYTSRGYMGFSPWIEKNYEYSLVQLNMGSNSISKLEVVSFLNLLSQSAGMYSWRTTRTPKYNLKIYFGTTLQIISRDWVADDDFKVKHGSENPAENLDQTTQKQVIF